MANTKLLEQEVHNLAEARGAAQSSCPSRLTYQTPADTLERLPEIVEEAVRPLKTCKLVRCVATQFGPSSIDCELVYDDRTIDPDTLARHKSAVIIDCHPHLRARRNRLRLPDPDHLHRRARRDVGHALGAAGRSKRACRSVTGAGLASPHGGA